MSRKKSPQLGIILNTGDRIRKIRGKLTQTEFGRLLGVKGNTVSRWEAGRLSDLETLKKIAAFGGVAVEWLVKGEETAPAPQLQEHAPEVYETRRPEPLETPLIYEVLLKVEETINDSRLKLSLEKRARLIALVYEHCRRELAHPDHILVKRYLLLSD